MQVGAAVASLIEEAVDRVVHEVLLAAITGREGGEEACRCEVALYGSVA